MEKETKSNINVLSTDLTRKECFVTFEVLTPETLTESSGKLIEDKSTDTNKTSYKVGVDRITSLVPDEAVRIPNTRGMDAVHNLAATSHVPALEKESASPANLKKTFVETVEYSKKEGAISVDHGTPVIPSL